LCLIKTPIQIQARKDQFSKWTMLPRAKRTSQYLTKSILPSSRIITKILIRPIDLKSWTKQPAGLYFVIEFNTLAEETGSDAVSGY
jgi:hypothetical protein